MQSTRLKHRKQQKGRNAGIATHGNKASFGEFGLKAADRGRLTIRQIEATRCTVARHIKRGDRIWVHVLPDKLIAEKLIQVRMGGGKGNMGHYIAEVKLSKVLYEMDGIPEALAHEASELAVIKLPIPTTFVVR